MKHFLLSVGVLLGLATHGLRAQDRAITGKVTAAEDGSALPGVSINVKGTTIGTISAANGTYELAGVPAGANLVFSFIGLVSQEASVGNRSVIDVALKADVRLLNEVVVTAVGIQAEKKSLGYTVQTVNGSDLSDSRETNLVSGLAGKAAGVLVTSSAGSPGAAAQIRIRGNRSIVGDNSPLFVVDGIPIDNSANNTQDPSGGVNNSNRAIDLNPDDIATTTILKGPSATSLYGIRAANGAIIITTKRGKQGRPTLQFTSSYSLDEVNRLPSLQKEFAQGRSTAGGIPTYRGPQTGEGFSWGPRISDLRYDPSVANPFDKNGAIVSATGPADARPRVNAYNNYGNFFQTANTLNNHLSFSGGNGNTNYYFSAGNLRQTGIVPRATFNRTTLKASFDSKLTDKFSMSASATFSVSGGSRIQQGSNISGVMLGLSRTAPTFDISNGFGGRGFLEPSAYSFANGTQREYRGSGIYDNPLWTVNKNTSTDEVNRLIGYVQLNYELLPWLKATARLGGDVYSDTRRLGIDVGSATFPAGQVINDNYVRRDYNTDLLLLANKKLGSDLDLSVTLGHNSYQSNQTSVTAQGQTLAQAGLFTLSNAATLISSESVTRRMINGLFGNATLSFRDMLFVNVSGRNDWSSTLPQANNSFFYPAASIGFVFTEGIKSLKEGSFLSFGKLRAQIGNVGADAPVYATSSYYNRAATGGNGFTDGLTFPFAGSPAFITSPQIGNPNLKAENTRTWEVGAELRFFKDRLSIDASYYDALTTNGIVPVSIPASSGFTSQFVNAVEISNKGLEILVDATVVKTERVQYSIGINFTRYRNIVNKLAPGLDTYILDSFGNQRVVAGQPFGVFYGTRYLRQEGTGALVISPTTGLPLADPTQGVVGNPNPDWIGGLRNTVSFAGFTLTALLDVRQGAQVFNSGRSVLNGFGVGAETLNRNDKVTFAGVVANPDGTASNTRNSKEVTWGGVGTPTTTGTNFYRAYGFTGLDERNVQDGSWIRLRQLTLAYAVPRAWLAKAPVKAISLSFTGRNLWLRTKYDGVDPETNLTGSSTGVTVNSFGIDYFNMPNTRSYAVTLNVTL